MDILIWPFRLIGIYLFDVIPIMLLIGSIGFGFNNWREDRARTFKRASFGDIFGAFFCVVGAIAVARLVTGYPRWLGWIGL